MATFLAPYNTAMQLGQGFCSFTQQLGIDRAVIRDADDASAADKTPTKASVAQSVSYRVSIVDKATDVTNAMNINAAFAIKNDAFDAKGKGGFVDTNKIKESDISFLIHVKVTNQVVYDNTLTKFNPIAELKGRPVTDVYGDCFISGFQEGGEFTAVISIKATERAKADSIKANAAITFTNAKLQASADGDFGKEANSLMTENETTISVNWTGGGQHLKEDNEDWTFETMRAAALKFPTLVAETPIRTHAVLTKLTALRSFWSTTLGAANAAVPDYELAGVYTEFLHEAYLDYKAIAKNLHTLSYDVSVGTQKLLASPQELAQQKPASSTGAAVPATSGASAASSSEKPVDTTQHDSDPDTVLVSGGSGSTSTSAGNKGASIARITKPFPATISGLEQARQAVRRQLNRIVGEVDAISRSPELAVDENRALPYMSPLEFRDLLPTGEMVQAPDNTPGQPGTTLESKPQDGLAAHVAGMADGAGGVARF